MLSLVVALNTFKVAKPSDFDVTLNYIALTSITNL
jgi:hypothetical protein